jgi:hypothetical protein
MDAGSKDSVKSILEWLEGTDETGWEAQINLGGKCRSDMERAFSTPARNSSTPDPVSSFVAGALVPVAYWAAVIVNRIIG